MERTSDKLVIEDCRTSSGRGYSSRKHVTACDNMGNNSTRTRSGYRVLESEEKPLPEVE